MKKYLREIEVSGVILMFVGFIISMVSGSNFGVWPCIFGIFLWVIVFLYRAFHWKEYERENKQGIIIVLLAIALLIFNMLTRR
ncbi:MAG: hypothetical protein IJ190_07485 [Prevotella sp.]|nr:hypothetical protein [Prevotella sp.]MBQ9231011.1 hypothetical protein [Prevotella sp.]